MEAVFQATKSRPVTSWVEKFFHLLSPKEIQELRVNILHLQMEMEWHLHQI